jgi:hypothetical protein
VVSRDAPGRQRVLAARFGALAAVILASIAAIMLAPAASGDRVAGHLLQALPVFVGAYLAGRSTQLAAAAALVLVASAALSSAALRRDEAMLLAADAAVARWCSAGSSPGWCARCCATSACR